MKAIMKGFTPGRPHGLCDEAEHAYSWTQRRAMNDCAQLGSNTGLEQTHAAFRSCKTKGSRFNKCSRVNRSQAKMCNKPWRRCKGICHKAMGIDQLAADHYKQLGPQQFEDIAQFFNTCEAHRRFPEVLAAQKVIFLPKTTGPQTVSNQRPIVLLSHLVKVWGRCRLRFFQLPLEQFPEMLGGRGGITVQEEVGLLQMELHYANAMGHQAAGAHLDLTK
eukprot:6491563-Amphidinium_carterae.1